MIRLLDLTAGPYVGWALAAAAASAAVLVSSLIAGRLERIVDDEAGMRLLGSPGVAVRAALTACAGLLGALGGAAVASAAASRGGTEADSAAEALAGFACALAAGIAAGASPHLALIDLRIHRLPDRIVLPLTAAALALLGLSALLGAPGALRPLLAVGIGLSSAAGLLALSLALGRGRPAIGLGDVKLAVVCAGLPALVGLGSLVVALVALNVSALVAALVSGVLRGRGMRARIAYGPHMLIGMWAGVGAAIAL